jgi:tRNA-dihydrouridine synthase
MHQMRVRGALNEAALLPLELALLLWCVPAHWSTPCAAAGALQDNSAVRADWDGVAAVRAAVQIPVLANGDVQCMADAQRLIAHTKADGVLSAEPLLSDPALFSSTREPQVRWPLCCSLAPCVRCVRQEAASAWAITGMVSLSVCQRCISTSNTAYSELCCFTWTQ